MEFLLIPLLAALPLFFIKSSSARYIALGAALLNLGLTFYRLSTFNADGSLNFVTDVAWIQAAGIHFKIGMDGISMLLVLLTNLLIPVIIQASASRKFDHEGQFYGLVLLMQMGLIGVFSALDGFLFYVFWEITLIPVYFICAIWGGEGKNRITLKFFIYTFAGSLLMLFALLYLYTKMSARGMVPSFDWASLVAVAQQLPLEKQAIVLAGMFAAFAIKMPIFPFHTWQPDTYTVAPTAGSMLLSGIMLKMGIYGVIRWMIPLAPLAFHQYAWIMILLAVIGILYAAIIAIQQDDLKRLIAYSSISHVGLIAAGVLSWNVVGLQGGIIQMLNHGINVVGLFFVADVIERRTGTRLLSQLGGIAKNAPKFAVMFMIVLLGSMAVPLTNAFVGEFLLLNGVYRYDFWTALVAGLTLIFCAVYMLRAYQYTMFGVPNEKTASFQDLSVSELAVFGVLAVLILGLGVYPQPVLDLTAASVDKLVATF